MQRSSQIDETNDLL